MKAIEVYETLGQRENDQQETKVNRHYPDAGGAHGSQNNNRASLNKIPLNEVERQAAKDALATESKIMEENPTDREILAAYKKNQLTNLFDQLTLEEQIRALNFSKLSADFQKTVLDEKGREIDPVLEFSAPPLPIKGDASYQELPPYSRMSNEELKDFVKENWGQYLKAFNTDLTTDAISRKELKNYDARLMNRLEKLPPEELNNIIQTASEKLFPTPPTKQEIKEARQVLSFVRNHMNTDEALTV